MVKGGGNRSVNEQAREVIASILLFDVSDPRLENVTITGADVSYDRSVCSVYYTTTPANYEAAAEALERASGHIRTCMARELSWRQAPKLRFFRDNSVDQAEVIARALERESRRYNHASSES